MIHTLPPSLWLRKHNTIEFLLPKLRFGIQKSWQKNLLSGTVEALNANKVNDKELGEGCTES